MPQVPKEPLNDKTLRRVQQMHRWIRPPLRVAEHVRRREELSSVSGVTGERLDADLGAVFGGRLVVSRDLGEVEKGGEKFEKFERHWRGWVRSERGNRRTEMVGCEGEVVRRIHVAGEDVFERSLLSDNNG
jgi:hypothetical protein